MKKTMVLACVLGLALGAGSRADDVEKAEAAIKAIIKLQNDLTDVLKSMKDEGTIKAAVPKLKKLKDTLQEVMKQGRNIAEKLSKKEEAELQKKYRKEFETAQNANAAELKRVGKLPGGREALDRAKGRKRKPDQKDEEKMDK
jgi:hypothetical protein